MDVNTTVAVDIMVRTSLGNSPDQFNKALARMEADAKSWVQRMNKIMGGLNMGGGGMGGGSGGGGVGFNSNITRTATGARGGAAYRDERGRFASASMNDPAMKAALRDVERYAKDRKKWETDYTNHVNKETEKRFQVQQRAIIRTRDAMVKGFNSIISASEKAAQQLDSGRGLLSSTFWGVLAGNITSRIINGFINLPKIAAQYIDQAMNLASERQKAFQSLGTVTGGSAKQAETEIRNLRAVKMGLVDITDAVIAYRNLRLKLQLTDQQYIDILERTTDTMAFNKQATLSYGEALRRTTEGIRLGISTLSDAGGVVENLDAIIGRYGGDLKDLDDTHKKAAASLQFYKGFIDVTAASVGDADKLALQWAGTTAKLDAAQRNLSAALGTIIIQSPHLSAAINTITSDLNNMTTALKDSDSAATASTKSWTGFFAEIIVGARVAVNSITSLFQSLPSLFESIGLAITRSFLYSFGVVGEAIAQFSGIDDRLKKAGAEFERIAAASRQFDRSTWQEYYKNLSGGLGAPKGVYNPLTQPNPRALSTGRLPQLPSSMTTFNPSGVVGNRNIFYGEPIKGGVPTPKGNNFYGTPYTGGAITGQRSFGVAPVGTGMPDLGGDKAKKAKFVLGSRGQALANAASALGVDPLDLATIIGYETSGTYSPTMMGGGTKGRADYMTYKGLIQFSRENQRTYKVNQNLTFESQLMNSVVPYLQDRFAKAGMSTAGASITDLYKAINAGSPRASTFASDRPGENIGTHVGRMLRERRGEALAKFFGGETGNVPNVGKDEKDIANLEYQIKAMTAMGKIQEAMGKLPVTTTAGQVTTGGPVTRPEVYIAGLRDQLGLQTRLKDLAIREVAFQQEINALQEDYNIKLIEETYQEKVNLEMANRRLPLQEAELEFQKSRTSQVNETADIERDIEILRKQNADAEFVRQRRINTLAGERYGLEQEISQLKDNIANGSANDPLRIEAEYLREIVNLRNREADAVMSINASQLQIAQQTVYSANQATAATLQFMASQKGVTEIAGDFQIGLLNSGYELIDKTLDRILPKMGALSDTIKDMLGSFIRLALNAAFRRLFGMETGTSGGANAGGGGGNFLQQLFGMGGGAGGGGGTGFFGGTAPFNPNAGIGLGQGGGAVNLGILQQMMGGGAPTQVSGAPDLVSIFGGIGGVPTGVGSILAGGARVNAGGVLARPTGTTGAGLSGLGSAQLMNLIGGGITGGMLGVGLGAGSGVGSALGLAGGAVGGILAGGLLAAGGSITAATSATGLLAALSPATFGISAAIAGVLLLGAWLFGRSARKKKEIKAVNTASTDAMKAIEQLLADVMAMKIDGKSAVSQAEQIRDNFKESIPELKSKDARSLANYKVVKMNKVIDQIKSEGEKADRVRDIARITDERLIPTFAVGGYGTGFGGGAFPALLHPREAVLSPSNVYALGGYKALQEAGVRGTGLTDAFEGSYSRRGGGANSVFVVGVFDDSTADDIMDRISPHVAAKKVKFGIKNNLEGLYTTIERKLVSGD